MEARGLGFFAEATTISKGSQCDGAGADPDAQIYRVLLYIPNKQESLPF
jgi:hypothetical protein